MIFQQMRCYSLTYEHRLLAYNSWGPTQCWGLQDNVRFTGQKRAEGVLIYIFQRAADHCFRLGDLPAELFLTVLGEGTEVAVHTFSTGVLLSQGLNLVVQVLAQIFGGTVVDDHVVFGRVSRTSGRYPSRLVPGQHVVDGGRDPLKSVGPIAVATTKDGISDVVQRLLIWQFL